MKKNTLNSVHLDGFLEGFRVTQSSPEEAFAWASVVTLHPKPEAAIGGLSAGDKYEYLHHDIRIEADDEEGVLHLRSVKNSFESLRDSAELYPCSVNGMLKAENDNSFVSCKVENFRRMDLVKTNDKNIANIEAEISSVVIGRTHANMRIRLSEGVFDVFVSQKDNPDIWKSVSGGEVKKGDVMYMNGPLLSQRLTDGDKVLKMSAISPHHVQKRQLDKRIRKKGSQSI